MIQLVKPSAAAPRPHPDPEGTQSSGVPSLLKRPLAILVTPAAPTDVADVLQLQAHNSNSLGFLTGQAIEQYQRHQAIWVAIIWVPIPNSFGDLREVTAGYIISPPPRRRPPGEAVQLILQCVTDQEHRRRTIATAMVGKVVEDAKARGSIGLQATVAARLPANQFWRNAGFVHIGTRTPNNARNRELAVYRLPLTKKIPLWLADHRRNHAPANG